MAQKGHRWPPPLPGCQKHWGCFLGTGIQLSPGLLAHLPEGLRRALCWVGLRGRVV